MDRGGTTGTRSTGAWTRSQERALDAVGRWWREDVDQVFKLGGLAGTGKTTLIPEVEELLGERVSVRYAAPTGKAALVLRGKLQEAGVATSYRSPEGWSVDTVGTLHSLLYRPTVLWLCGCGGCEDDWIGEGACERPVRGDTGRPVQRVVYSPKQATEDADLIVVDEASMVTGVVWRDLLATGCRILAVGDHGQLPPVGDRHGPLEVCDVVLEDVVRQAEGSPIIQLAWHVRRTGSIPYGEWGGAGSGVVKLTARDAGDVMMTEPGPESLVVCGLNRTRVALNEAIKSGIGRRAGVLELGDRVICLKNARDVGDVPVFNGMRGTLVGTDGDEEGEVELDSGGRWVGPMWWGQFGRERPIDEAVPGTLWDWAYAITCHKAQGSEADSVVVVEEPFGSADDRRRWLYTAVTRARRELVVLG